MRIITLLFVVLLAGCGQKGPLYFAPEEPAEPVAAQDDNADQPAASEQDDGEQE